MAKDSLGDRIALGFLRLVDIGIQAYDRVRPPKPIEGIQADEAIRVAQESPDEISRLLISEMEKDTGKHRCTPTDLLLMCLPESDWPDLVSVAIGRLKSNKRNGIAKRVLEGASLQALWSVHPHLPDIFELAEWRQDLFAWRESGHESVHFLAEKLRTQRQESFYWDRKADAFGALLETRDPEAISLAVSSAKSLTAEALRQRLWDVDREMVDGQIRVLVPQAVYHYVLDNHYVLDEGRPIQVLDEPLGDNWPTWEPLSLDDYRHPFGGTLSETCGRCHEPLHRILTLDPVPSGLGVTAVDRLTIATCISCMGWEIDRYYCVHDSRGEPSAFERGEAPVVPQFPAEPMQEALAGIRATPARWRWQESSGMSNENVNRLGGHPTWIQEAEYPACPQCGTTMGFLMQSATEDGRVIWLNYGIAYFFWCDDCRMSASLAQCT